MRERDLLRLGIPPPDAHCILRNLPFRTFAPPFAEGPPGWPVPGWR